jgi:acyl-CoA thioesterase-2
VPPPDDPSLVDQGWGQLLERRTFATHEGPSGYWIRLAADIGDDPVLQACALAFMSDAAPSRAARRLHPDLVGDARDRDRFKGASLDHAVWFHRPVTATEWHWFATHAHGLYNARGIVTGDVYSQAGTHVATMAQQVLLRLARSPGQTVSDTV